MKKIYIIGGPGSGKTFISKVISKKTGIPFFELDNIFWKDIFKYSQKEDQLIRDKNFKEIVSRSSWIVEGSYYKWIDEGFKNADIIVILNISKIISSFRVITRSIRERYSGESKASFYSIYKMIKWGIGYDYKILPIIYKKADKYKNKVVIISSSKELSKLVYRIL